MYLWICFYIHDFKYGCEAIIFLHFELLFIKIKLNIIFIADAKANLIIVIISSKMMILKH